MKRSRLIINLLLSIVLFLFSSVNVSANTLNIATSKVNAVDYSSYTFSSYTDSNNNIVICSINPDSVVEDTVILETSTNQILYHGQVIGTYSSKAPLLKIPRSNTSSTWKYLGSQNYKITATGAGITAAAIVIIAGFVGGPAAATLLGGLSAFIGTATPGGTLTVQTWERYIGTQYYQKYRIKFTTSTGEVWGPVETIKAY
ncbi:MAG: hypothetical protein SOI16_04030 [Eubacteriales bacterium]|jgi:hypothetical protein